MGLLLGSSFDISGRRECISCPFISFLSLYFLIQVLLPLQTDPLLSSLYRTPKSHRPTSPTRQSGAKSSISSSTSSASTYHIDVRSVALKSFRDRVILPPFQRLYARLSLSSRQDGLQEANSYQQPRLQQM